MERTTETDGSNGSESQDTRVALLEAGRAHFARNGYEGSSVRALTRAAGVNLGAVTYHFGSKRALYEAVLGEALGHVVGAVTKAIASGPPDPDGRIETGVRALFDVLLDHPEAPPLMIHDLAAGQEPPEVVLTYLRKMAAAFGGAIASGQARGRYREGPATLLALSTVYQALHFTLVRRWWDPVLGYDPDDPDDRERVIRHALAFTFRGLRAPSADDGDAP